MPSKPLQTITLKQVKAAARKAYTKGILLAQHQTGKAVRGDMGYAIGKYRCAVGAALTSETIAVLEANNVWDGAICDGWIAVNDPTDTVLIELIQRSHDQWQQGYPEEKAFLALIGYRQRKARASI